MLYKLPHQPFKMFLRYFRPMFPPLARVVFPAFEATKVSLLMVFFLPPAHVGFTALEVTKVSP